VLHVTPKYKSEKNMELFDSHCHLNDASYANDMDDVVDRARTAGVKSAMVVGITAKTSRQALEIAGKYPGYYASVGIHPHDAKACTENAIVKLIEIARNPKVKAWGETGLDFNRMFSPQEIQEKWFIRQLDIADELELPLIFHERDSAGRFLENLNSRYAPLGRSGVVHCFSGNRHELEAYLKLGLHIGITGIVTIKGRGDGLCAMVPHIPAERILIETDAPYLTPAPEKNLHRRNEPAFVKSVLIRLAEVRKEDPERLAQTIWGNTCRLFNINSQENLT
jgi:TatD DNase family protein